jgi:hypothetical protein
MPLRAIFSKCAAAAPPSSAFQAGQVQLDAHQPLVEGALEQPRHRRGRHAQGLGDVLLALRLPVVELQALDHETELAGGGLGN